MLKSLKVQLLVSALAAIILLLAAVWCVTRAHLMLSIIIISIICIYLIFLNIWFWRKIIDPINGLTAFSKRIASGSYGIQLEKRN